MYSSYKYTHVTIVLLVSVMFAEVVAGATPVLTGRWGDTRLPQQLAYDYPSKKNQALVVVTFSTICPLAQRLVPTLNALQQKYDEQGIQFIAIFPNGMDDLGAIAEYAVDTEMAFPVFKDDPDNPWHERLGLSTTPGVAVLDTRDGFDDSMVYYRGQVDGMWFGGGTADGKQSYLSDALESFLAGEKPAVEETAASGCDIAKQAFRDDSAFADATYHRDIVPLLQKRCISCHREGEPGSTLFAAFDSYEIVASMSQVMLSRVENRLMPPWHASTEAANGLGGFKNDHRLTDEEINLFRAWVNNGCPAGDRADAPPLQTWHNPEDWQIGKPDLVFEMPEPYIVPKFRLDEYQYYRIPANFSEDRYIQAIEVKPGNKAVVHHIGVILGRATDKSLKATQAMLALYGITGDKVKKVGDYVAGDPFNVRTYDDDYAVKLPAGHDIFFEMHYTPTGKDEKPDVSKVGIIWAQQRPEHVLETKVFNRKDIKLRPHDMHYEKKGYFQFSTDVIIYALAPHMHYRGKDFTLYKAENPGTDSEKLEQVLKVSAYDINWQRTYEYQKPLRLKAGDALYFVTHFDNSHYNPNAPDPEATVRYGLKSEQEMLNLRVKFERVDFGESF